MNDRPRRQSARKCLNALRSTNIDTSSETEPATDTEEASDAANSDFHLSDFESSNSSSSSSAEPSDKFLSEATSEPDSDVLSNDDHSRQRRHITDDRHFHGSMVPQIASLLPPFGRVGFISNEPQKTVTHILKEEMNYHKRVCKEREHPFAFYPSNIHISEIGTYNQRYRLLFSLNELVTVAPSQIPLYLPESTMSPTVTFSCADEETNTYNIQRKRVPRYHFDKNNNLLYTGGYVKCVAWSPPLMNEDFDVGALLPSYLSISTLKFIEMRLKLSDPQSSGPGLIQVWKYQGLALTKAHSTPRLEPHFFLAHDWGTVTAMTWLPVPVICAGRNNPACAIPEDVLYNNSHTVSFRLSAIAGHLIVACTDGFVRVCMVPAADMRRNILERSRIVLPTFITEQCQPANVYTYGPSAVIRCGPDSQIPSWLGWPITISIRSEFPNRLVVGYTSGHLAFYDLSTLNSYFARFDEQLLRPMLLAHVISGPFTSLTVHPLYENIVIGLGLDRDVHMWDLSDPLTIECAVSELSWSTIRTGIGGLVVWPRAGDALWIGRQEYIFPFANTKRATEAIGKLQSPSDVPARMRSYTGCYPLVSPLDCCRWCFDRGFEPTSSMDYSDALVYLAHGEGGGRIQFHTWTTENRGVQRAKSRLDVQPSWTYQWYLRRLHKCRKQKDENEFKNSCPSTINLENELDVIDLNANDEEEEEEEKDFNDLTQDVTEESYGDDAIDGPCFNCNSKGPVLCWHKVDKYFQFVFHSGFNLPRPKFDFLNSIYLSISALAVSPNPMSATWMAVGTGFGFVQLICNEHFYHPDMDISMCNPPSDPLPYSIYTKARSQSSLRRSTTVNKSKPPTFGPSRPLGRPRKSGSLRSQRLRMNAVKKEEEEVDDNFHSDSTEPCTEEPSQPPSTA